MKKIIKYLLLSAFLLAGYGCLQIEEEGQPCEELVQMTFQATIEDNLTKTALIGDVADQHRNLVWLPGDQITVYSGSGSSGIFTNDNEESSEVANFTGEVGFSTTYYGVYPATAASGCSGSCVWVTIPDQQPYEVNTFASGANPMAAKASSGENMNFINLCGILVLNIRGNETIKSISLAAYDENGKLAQTTGPCCVDFSGEEPTISMDPQTAGYIQMDCGEGVTLDSALPTPFHFVMAPGSYSKISIMVTTVDGKIMVKEGVNPLTINRAEWVTAGVLNFIETEAIDLCESGTANCYVISERGVYSIDATVIGNGPYGLLKGENFHTNTVTISPVSADIIWQDRDDVLVNVSCDGEKLYFVTTGVEGNALVAAKDQSGNILWSWHIWVTDEPQTATYNTSNGGTYLVMDRNIGSTSAVVGEDNLALFYQWGRKDPFRISSDLRLEAEVISTFSNISESILSPTTVGTGGYWVDNLSTSAWSTSVKTIYDPCPLGWKVPGSDIWTGITRLHDYDNSPAGVVFGFNSEDSFWYPDSPRFDTGAQIYGNYKDDDTELWTAEYGISYFLKYNTSYPQSRSTPDGYPVRCVQDSGYESTRLPYVTLNGATARTSSTLTLSATVVSEGWDAVIDCGFMFSENSDMSGAEFISCGSSNGEFSYTISGLSNATAYYAKAYAVNEHGGTYTAVGTFRTKNLDNPNDLSADGTANCYIVNTGVGTYFFSATEGNSNDPVNAESAEILWQVDGSRNVVDNLIGNVRISDGKISFDVMDCANGNALIVAKDADETIVWSWHIWVVDYDPELDHHTYYSGAKMMTRNLGAVVEHTDSNIESEWVQGFGPLYQWGRKDPLVYPVMKEHRYTAYTDLAEAYANPNQYAYGGANWLSSTDYTLWSESEKTKHDPCPWGWKVPSRSVWEGVEYRYRNSSYGEKFKVGDDVYAWYVYNDYIHSNANYNVGNSSTYYWTTDINYSYNSYAYAFHVNSGYTYTSMYMSDSSSIRCMKEE